MLKLLPIAFQIVGVAIGAAGGLFLKYTFAGDPSADTEEATHLSGASENSEGKDKSEKNDNEDKDKKKKDKKDKKKGDKKKKDKSKDKDGYDKSDSGYGYVKFSRQFIVPVVNTNGVNSLFVLDISLEVDSSQSEDAYAKEPKLRDAILNALLKLSNEGAFSNQFLREENIANIRSRLLEAAQPILDGQVNDVLILSISRQDL